MKYKIESSSYYHSIDELLEEYPFLTEFGYTVEEKRVPDKVWIRDENGRKIWQETMCTIQVPYIFLNSLEELDRLAKATVHPLIYSNNITDYHPEPSIEIYDGYRE